MFRPALLLAACLGGCATTVDAPRGPSGLRAQSVELLPFVNASGKPHAAERAEALTMTLLSEEELRFVPYRLEPAADGLPVIEDEARYRQALTAAQARGAQYGLTGTVVEWGYKNGLDGHPVASVSLRLVELSSGNVVWSASASRSGWGRDSVGRIAQLILRDLVQRLASG